MRKILHGNYFAGSLASSKFHIKFHILYNKINYNSNLLTEVIFEQSVKLKF